jgi:hypothetical protein
MIGIIYHVIDKTTDKVIRVGSTIRSLKIRWSMYDKKKFSNHFLREAKRIESNLLNEYDKENPRCPFLWHLVAAEHVEMIRMNTYRTSPLANQLSPLQQKYIGFDAWENAKIGASIGGKASFEQKRGIHNPKFDKTGASRKGGIANVESGHLQFISSKGGLACGALMEKEKKGIFSPDYDRVAAGRKYGKISGKIGGPKGMHNRWHVNQNKPNPRCALCSEQSLIIAYA